jgi:protein-disulfide isomerase
MVMYINNILRRVCCLALVVCVGCAAQSASPDLDRRIEKQIRSFYTVPPQVGVSVGPKKPSAEFANYDEFVVTFTVGEKKQEQNFLVSKDGKSLVRLAKMDLTKDPFADLMNKIDVSGRPVRGNKDAKVTIINYDDFQCPFCARMHETLTSDILRTYGNKVKLIYKDYPLTEIHPWAKRAAINANCLAQLSQPAYWSFADTLHANAKSISQTRGTEAQSAEIDRLTLLEGQKSGVNTTELQSCVKAQKDDKVSASMSEAETLGVSSTPTLFVNGQKLEGAVPPDDLKLVINRALADAGESVPATTSQKPGNGGR